MTEQERIVEKLAEARALLERVKERRLEADDWAAVGALVSEIIEEAEPGQEWVTIGCSEDGAESGERADRAAGAARSKSEKSR